jgi:predicted RNA methylase
VTETVIPHLKAMGANTIWEPAAGEGSMAGALVSAGFRVVSTDLKNRIDFLDDKTGPDIAQRADAVVTNPPYGIQGKTAEKFIEQP